VRERNLLNEKSPRSIPPPDEGRRFFCALGAQFITTYPMSTRRTYSSRSRLLRRVDNGFIPIASKDFGEITVQCVDFARDSWWHFCVRRKRPGGQYGIRAGGPHIGGAARDVTPEEAANYLLSRSPHWDTLKSLTKQSGWNDVHRILIAVTRYGFIPMKLPIPEC
jgi:hypothetical protein